MCESNSRTRNLESTSLGRNGHRILSVKRYNGSPNVAAHPCPYLGVHHLEVTVLVNLYLASSNIIRSMSFSLPFFPYNTQQVYMRCRQHASYLMPEQWFEARFCCLPGVDVGFRIGGLGFWFWGLGFKAFGDSGLVVFSYLGTYGPSLSLFGLWGLH